MHSMFTELCDDDDESVFDTVANWTKVVLVLGLVFGSVFMCGYATARIQMHAAQPTVVAMK